MTTASPIPAAGAAPTMAHPSDTASEAQPAQAGAAASARPTMRAQIAENPLLSFFGLLIVALLGAAVASPHIRINDTNARIDRLEASMGANFDELEEDMDDGFDKVDARFEEVDARLDELEDKVHSLEVRMEARFDELDRKLTALIAHLSATSAVDNALEGRLAGMGDDAAG